MSLSLLRTISLSLHIVSPDQQRRGSDRAALVGTWHPVNQIWKKGHLENYHRMQKLKFSFVPHFSVCYKKCTYAKHHGQKKN